MINLLDHCCCCFIPFQNSIIISNCTKCEFPPNAANDEMKIFVAFIKIISFLSGNHLLTNRCVKYIYGFRQLEFLDMSCTGVTVSITTVLYA